MSVANTRHHSLENGHVCHNFLNMTSLMAIGLTVMIANVLVIHVPVVK
jgi:hypothetical protein